MGGVIVSTESGWVFVVLKKGDRVWGIGYQGGMRIQLLLMIAVVGMARGGDPWKTDGGGRVVFAHDDLPVELRNEWPAEWEEGFVERTNASLRASGIEAGKYGGTFFENEKSSYPNAIIGLLKGQRKEALAFLQGEDDAAWSKELTMGVDWFPAFTIRSQTRKYFQFGGLLEPGYLARMKESARVWTAEDPLGRKNRFWVRPEERRSRGMGGEGWTPEYHNSWVDVRGTDNLRAMREQAIYLMAEETCNRETMAAALKRIREYAEALYASGMPEWDSPNYLNHALTSWLPLYDFAKDREVRKMAKAMLDYVSVSAALKYWRGSWAGPGIRDYGNIGPHAGAAGEFWHYYGGLEGAAKRPYRDFVHVMASGYRPPAAAVALARREITKPVEVLAAKPSYTGWQAPGGEEKPAFFETTWLGHHAQMGSLPQGHADPPGMNLNGFRLLAESGKRGADTLIFFSSLEWNHSHASATNGGDRIGQLGNVLVWLNEKPGAELFLFLPKSAEVVNAGERVFVRLERTWVALTLVRAKATGVHEAATAKACGPRKPGEEPAFPDDQVWGFKLSGEGPGGFALEVGEPETHGDFGAFREAVQEKAVLDLGRAGEVHYTASRGEKVGLVPRGAEMPEVYRNGERVDWRSRWAQWGGEGSPVQMGWKTGELRVRAGGREFAGKLP